MSEYVNILLLSPAYYSPNYVRSSVKFGVESIEDAISKLQIHMNVSWMMEIKQ